MKILIPAILCIFAFLAVNTCMAEGAGKSAIEGLDTAAGWGYSNSAVPGSDVIEDVPLTIGKIVGYALSFVGIIFLLLMIYAGFLWMLARGNDQQVEKAKNLITAAIIGLIIVLSAYMITALMGDILTNGN